MMLKLSASMTCIDPLEYPENMKKLDCAGIDAYHFDMCDGHFAPTFLLNPGLLKSLKSITDKRFDVHLYCTHPSYYIDELAENGADVIVIHYEAEENYHKVINQILEKGLGAGLAFLPSSRVPDNIDDILPLLSQVVTNTVGPAYAGQPFNMYGIENMNRINKSVSELGLNLELIADGSVSVSRLELFFAAGANHLVCGTSSVFRACVNVDEELQKFRRIAENLYEK